MPRNPCPGRHSNLPLSQVEGHRQPEFIRLRIKEEEAAEVRLHHLGGFPGDLPEDFIELQVKTEEPAKFEQGLKFADPVKLSFCL